MITIHPADATDFTSLGYGALLPTECTITEEAGGNYTLEMTHPIDDGGRWYYLRPLNIIKAPSPSRETPLDNLTARESAAETITRRILEVRVPRTRLRLRAQPSTSSAVLGAYGSGTRVKEIGTATGWAQVVVLNGGATGWMSTQYLTHVDTIEEEVPGTKVDIPAPEVKVLQTRDQLFRIVTADRDDANGTVHVTAQHISYDLAYIPIAADADYENKPCLDAVSDLFGKALWRDHPFTAYSNCTEPVTGEYGYRGLLEALLETDGVVPQSGARLIRDNYDLYILADEERDLGFTIRHGKNLTGATLTEDVDGVVNRIIPEGTDGDGNPLHLPGTIYIDSPRMSEQPVIRAKKIDYDVRVGDGEGQYPSTDAAIAKLRELVSEDFDSGIDLPTVELDVDFTLLDGTSAASRYKALQTVHLYDTVRVISERSLIDMKLRVRETVWNCITERYDSMALGEIVAGESTISGFDISAKSVSGSKIMANSIPSGAFRQAIIQYAHIQQAAIDQLSADAITALSAYFGRITAQTVDTDTLLANLANVVRLVATEISGDSITANTLSAAVAKLARAEIESAAIENADIAALKAAVANVATAYIDWATVIAANIGSASIDYAQIKYGNIGRLIADDAVEGRVLIERLQVLSAQLARATIGELVVKAADDHYYRLDVSAGGAVTATDVTEDLTPAEIQAGVTSDGRGSIIETSLTVEDLAAGNLKAINALIDHITADRIDAGVLFARQAVVNEVYTQIINGLDASGVNQRIELNSQGIAAAVESVDGLSTRVAQTESDLSLKVNASDVEAWARYSVSGGEGTLELGQKGSRYTTETSPTGFRVKQDGQDMTTMVRGRVASPVFEVRRQIEIGNYSVRADAEGGVLFI